MGFGLSLPPTVVGTGWLLIAAVGAILTVSMAVLWVSDEHHLFKTQSNREQIQQFRNDFLSSTPLYVYAIALVSWSFLTVGWAVTNLALVGHTTVAYGWFSIAVYGLGLVVGLTTTHRSTVIEKVGEVIPDSIRHSTGN